MIFVEDFFETVAQVLKFVAPSRFGKKWLADNTDGARRYVWVLTSDTVVKNDKLDYSLNVIATASTTVQIHCRGKTAREAELMRRYLINAFWKTPNIPREWWKYGPATWIENEHSQNENVIVQSIQIDQPIEDMHFPEFFGDPKESCEGLAHVAWIVHEHSDTPGDGELTCDHTSPPEGHHPP